MTIIEPQTEPDAVAAGPLTHAGVWFGGLFDDAAMFPPRRAHPTDAVVEHRAWRSSAHADFVGPFVCSDAQWQRVNAQLENDDEFSIALTVPGGVAGVDQAISALKGHPVSLAQVEVPVLSGDELVGATNSLRQLVDAGTQVYVELPVVDVAEAVCADLVASGLRLKMRTGGVAADAFPTELELASAISACVRSQLTFKLSAGLHHAVRHRAMKTGFEHHGFLNVLLATSAAVRGSDASCLATMLGLEHSDVIAAALRSLDLAQVKAVREQFVSFGTCSISDPIADLVGLGLITEPS